MSNNNETTLTDRLNQFNELMESIIPDYDENGYLRNSLLERGFFTAPASTTHHGNYEGGLFDHSCRVARFLAQLTENNNLQWLNHRSPILVGIFHDLCKIDNYKIVNGNYVYVTDTLLKGHGDKSVMLLSQYFQLTSEEILCIRYHMGAFVDKEEWQFYTRAVHECPNVLWTHTADMLASHVEGI